MDPLIAPGLAGGENTSLVVTPPELNRRMDTSAVPEGRGNPGSRPIVIKGLRREENDVQGREEHTAGSLRDHPSCGTRAQRCRGNETVNTVAHENENDDPTGDEEEVDESEEEVDDSEEDADDFKDTESDGATRGEYGDAGYNPNRSVRRNRRRGHHDWTVLWPH
ncbi:MAG: hypothetical protein Q9174_005620 [Haloplaca sp. 1 TL-2023]